ncbi:Uncharacterised protein [Vibrio cholerae]|nr:Uncharacterised protein [Vibrio cholerae]
MLMPGFTPFSATQLSAVSSTESPCLSAKIAPSCTWPIRFFSPLPMITPA